MMACAVHVNLFCQCMCERLAGLFILSPQLLAGERGRGSLVEVASVGSGRCHQQDRVLPRLSPVALSHTFITDKAATVQPRVVKT